MDSRSRSLAKAISYRVVGSLSTVGLIYLLTGNMKLSIGGGLLDSGVKIVLYFFHERVWAKIPMGRSKNSEFEL